MKKTSFVSISLVIFTGLAACSKSDDATVAPNAIAGAINAVSEKVQQADVAQYSSSSSITSVRNFLQQNNAVVPFVAPGTLAANTWNNTSSVLPVSNLYCGGGACSPNQYALKDWIVDMLSPTFVNSNGASVGLMGRFTAAVGFACQIGQMLGGGTTLPAATTSTQTLTVDLATFNAAGAICGRPAQDSLGENGETSISVNYDIADVTGTFEKRFHFVSAGFDQYLYIGLSGGVYSVLSAEQNPDRPTHFNRYYASYDTNSSEARFEGIEKAFPITHIGDDAQGGFYFYRVYVNDSTKDISILGQNGGITCTASSGSACTTMTQLTNRTLVGGTGNTEVANATLGFYVGNGATTYDSLAENSLACIDMTTGTHQSTGSCGPYPLTNLANAETMVNSGDGLGSTGSAYSLLRSGWKTDETISALTFTGTTIFTVNPTN